MRLFTGISLPPELMVRMESLVEELKPLAAARWTQTADLHITTKFIGEWPEGRLNELIRELGFPSGPFPVTLEGFGNFPGVFWAGVRKTQELFDLVSATSQALEKLGVETEPRPYQPHLTLARTRQVISAPPVSEPFGAFEAAEFHLYQSRNSAYTKLATFPLQ